MDTRSQSVDSCVPDGSTGSMAGLNNNSFTLRTVATDESGDGLPFAPENFPNPGDIWKWRAGFRIKNGFIRDRYLYLPSHLKKPGTKYCFRSKLAVQEYVRKEFPDANIDAFISSFSWRMPYDPSVEGAVTISSTNLKEELTECSGDELKVGAKDCKAGNEMCSLRLRAKGSSLPAMDCNICCSEPGFCRDCCCVLCCKTIDWAYEDYSVIKCEAAVGGNCICGHIAHMDCALSSYMAGTVGGFIGIDVEYYCRRCDNKTDLILHVTRLLQVCESLDSRSEIGKILNLGFCILRGSQKESAKRLLHRVELALAKLRSGSCLDHIWNMEDTSANLAGALSHSGNNGTLSASLVTTSHQVPMAFTEPCNLNNTQQPVNITPDRIDLLKLDEQIERVLQDLKKSQKTEYRIAKNGLHAQKNLLLDLYKELEKERSELARHKSSSTEYTDTLVANVLNKVSQINREKFKLVDMKEVAKGFARVPKLILKEYFGLQDED